MGLAPHLLLGILANGRNAIGGLPLGAIGSGIYAGYKMVDGATGPQMFAGLISASNLTGSFGTSRAYGPSLGSQRAITNAGTTGLTPGHDCDPNYTGYNDANRGVAIPWVGTAPHSLVANDTAGQALRLHAVRQDATVEKPLLATVQTTSVERTSMIHMAARMWLNGNAILEYRLKCPASGVSGQHTDWWATSLLGDQNPTGHNGNDYGWEGNSQISDYGVQQYTNGTSDDDSLFPTPPTLFRDNNYHLFTSINVDGTGYNAYFDGSFYRTSTRHPEAHGNDSEYPLVTNHAYNASYPNGAQAAVTANIPYIETYSATAWASASSGCDIDIDYWRVWVPVSGGAYYKPLANITSSTLGTTNVCKAVAGTAFSLTLPSQSALWGATGLTESLRVMQSELAAPYGAIGTVYDSMPSGITADLTARTVSGTIPSSAGSGALHFVMYVKGDGIACYPLHFVIAVAPIFVGATSQAFSNGTPVSMDVYPMWDVGTLFQTGSNKKGLAVTGLPAGLSFSSTTGFITGTPTTNSTGTIVMTSVNVQGQSTSQNVTWAVTSAAAAVPKPSGITGTLVASWDPGDAATITMNGDAIHVASISGSDSTSFTLSATGTAGPTLALVGGHTAMQFNGAQFLSLVSAMGLAGSDFTVIAVVQPTSVAATGTVFDLSAPSGTNSQNRRALVGSTASGWGYRKCDSTGTSAIASAASSYTAALSLLVARSSSGAAQPAILNFNGVGTAVSSGSSAGPTSESLTTMGAWKVSSANTNFFVGYVLRFWIYSTKLSDADAETYATYCATNFGTTNAA